MITTRRERAVQTVAHYTFVMIALLLALVSLGIASIRKPVAGRHAATKTPARHSAVQVRHTVKRKS